MIEIGENQRSGEYGGWDRPSQSSSNNFCRVLSKTYEAAHCLDETRRPFDLLFLNVFVQLLSSIRLIGNNTSLNLSSRCLVKAHNTGSLSNPTDIEHDLLWTKIGFWDG